jgi:PST family polysaccharide transporter
MQVMGYFFWGTLVLSVVITFFSDEIIFVLYGPDYSRAAGVLSIHIYAGIITSMGVVFGYKFLIDGTTKISFYGTIAGAVSNVLLNLWLIKSYGAYGAAVSTLISYIMPIIFQTIFFDKRNGLIFFGAIVYFFKKIKV